MHLSLALLPPRPLRALLYIVMDLLAVSRNSTGSMDKNGLSSMFLTQYTDQGNNTFIFEFEASKHSFINCAKCYSDCKVVEYCSKSLGRNFKSLSLSKLNIHAKII